MPPDGPRDTPSLEDVFGSHSLVVRTLNSAHIYSVVPAMLMPKSTLIELPGVGLATVSYISRALADHGLGHRKLDERVFEFVSREFNCVEYTPIAALNVTVQETKFGHRPFHNPLRLARFIDKVKPGMNLVDLMVLNREGIINSIDQYAVHGPDKLALRREVKELYSRLTWWAGGMQWGVSVLPARPQRPTLRVVK